MIDIGEYLTEEDRHSVFYMGNNVPEQDKRKAGVEDTKEIVDPTISSSQGEKDPSEGPSNAP